MYGTAQCECKCYQSMYYRPSKSLSNHNVLNIKTKTPFSIIKKNSFSYYRWQQLNTARPNQQNKTENEMKREIQNISICQNIDNFIISYLWLNVSIAIDNYWSENILLFSIDVRCVGRERVVYARTDRSKKCLYWKYIIEFIWSSNH